VRASAGCRRLSCLSCSSSASAACRRLSCFSSLSRLPLLLLLSLSPLFLRWHGVGSLASPLYSPLYSLAFPLSSLASALSSLASTFYSLACLSCVSSLAALLLLSLEPLLLLSLEPLLLVVRDRIVVWGWCGGGMGGVGWQLRHAATGSRAGSSGTRASISSSLPGTSCPLYSTALRPNTLLA
jgi:hypothetical protein